MNRDSIVSIVTDYRMGGQGIRFRFPDRKQISLFSAESRLALRLSQLAIKWVPGVKRQGCETGHLIPSTAEVTNGRGTSALPICLNKQRVKAIPVSDRAGQEGCEASRLPHFLDNRLTDVGEVVTLTQRPIVLYTQGTFFVFISVRDWVNPLGHSAAGTISSIEKSNDLIGNQTRHFPSCIIVPQPTTIPRALV
jgi:hypothetical protein